MDSFEVPMFSACLTRGRANAGGDGDTIFSHTILANSNILFFFARLLRSVAHFAPICFRVKAACCALP